MLRAPLLPRMHHVVPVGVLTLFLVSPCCAQPSPKIERPVIFEAVDSLSAQEFANLMDPTDVYSKSGVSLTYWQSDPESGRERRGGRVQIGVVAGRTNDCVGEVVVVARVWANESDTQPIVPYSTRMSRASNTATLVFGTSAQYESCKAASVSCSASLAFINVSDAGKVESSSGYLGAAVCR